MTDLSYRNFTGTAAENYERHFVPAIAMPVSAGLMTAADLQPGERVLDVACGTGVVTRLAAEQVGATGSVTAVDIAPDMIEVARATPVPAGAPVDWRVGDAIALPIDDASHDVVLCQMGLMFLEDRAGAVAEMRRVLTPGGRLIVNTPGPIQQPFELMAQAIATHIDPELSGFVRAVFSMHDQRAVAELLGSVGLRDVSASTYRATLDLPAPAHFLWQYVNLTPMGPLVARAPEAARSAMEAEVVEGWRPFVADGRTRIEQPMVLVRGRR